MLEGDPHRADRNISTPTTACNEGIRRGYRASKIEKVVKNSIVSTKLNVCGLSVCMLTRRGRLITRKWTRATIGKCNLRISNWYSPGLGAMNETTSLLGHYHARGEDHNFSDCQSIPNDSRQLLNETEDLGGVIIEGLEQDRQSLQRSHSKIAQTDVLLGEARSITEKIERRAQIERMCLYTIILLLLVAIGVTLYLKLKGHDETYRPSTNNVSLS